MCVMSERVSDLESKSILTNIPVAAYGYEMSKSKSSSQITTTTLPTF